MITPKNILCAVAVVLMPVLSFAQVNPQDTSKVSLPPITAEALQLDEQYLESFETLVNLEDEDYDALKLPSLNTLLENAINSAKYKQYDGDILYAISQVKTARRRWQQWFRLYANFNYGNADMMAMQYVESGYPIWNYQNTNQQQKYWTVGASFSLPFNDIFNYNNRVKEEKARLMKFEGQRAAALEEVKLNIVNLYVEILKELELFKVNSENLAAAEAQYAISEADFINGAISVHDLFIMKNYHSGAQLSYAECKARLNEALLSLEIVTNTPIVSMLKAPLQKTPEELEQEMDGKNKNKKNKKRNE